MYKLFNNVLFAPEDSSSGGSMGVDDMVDFLSADDEPEIIPLDDTKKSDKKAGKDSKDSKSDDSSDKDDEESKNKSKKSKSEDSEEDEESDDENEDSEEDDLSDLEDEVDGPTDEQLELVTPVRRKEILAKYPKLFKDFPYLEKAYYREQQYTELLPTIDDAKEVIEKAKVLDNFESDLMGGNTELMLKAVKAESPKSFNKIVDGYLDTLARVDERAFHHVIGNTIKQTIISMVNEAKASNNEALQSAAQLLNQFVFGSSNFVAPKNLSTDDDKKSEKTDDTSRERQEFIKERFTTARDDLNSRVGNAYKSTIDANIDPKKQMSDYVKKTASRDALENVEKLIAKDSRFKIILDKLWEKALQENFSKTSTDRIRSAYLSKAKTLLPAVIKGARTEALKGMGKRVQADDNDSKEESPKKSDKSQSTSKSDKSTKLPSKGMTSLEFLMADD